MSSPYSPNSSADSLVARRISVVSVAAQSGETPTEVKVLTQCTTSSNKAVSITDSLSVAVAVCDIMFPYFLNISNISKSDNLFFASVMAHATPLERACVALFA
jgi:hypothetical protein